MQENLLGLVEQAGVVGAGGAGFPTHVKLKAQADTVIINGAECEPLLRVDQQLMALQAGDLLDQMAERFPPEFYRDLNGGISLLPEFVVREHLEKGELVVLHPQCPPILMWSQLVYHRNKYVTPLMALFLDLMKQRLQGEGA